MSTLKVMKAPVGGSHWEMLSLQETLSVLDRVAEQPSISNMIGVLQKCRKEKSIEYAKHMHAQVCNNGLEGKTQLENCGNVSDAQKAFDRLTYGNEHAQASLIAGHSEYGSQGQAFSLQQEMQKGSLDPIGYTLAAELKACSQLRDVEKGREIHLEIRRKGFEKDAFVGSMLIDMYVKCGHLGEAQEIFDKMPVRDAFTWTTLIGGYAEHGSGQQALSLYEQMQLEGMPPSAFTFVCSLKACGNVGAIDKGRQIHSVIVKGGLENDPFVGNALVDMYIRCGSFMEAEGVFNRMPVHNIVSWNALITGYAENGLGQESLKCFEQMQLEGTCPNVVTSVCTLKACGSIRDLNRGRAVHTKIAQLGLEKDVFVVTSLVDMYAKCGSLEEAREIVDKTSAKDVALWNAMIAGYAENGLGSEALKCFDKMQSESMSPDAVTFACILRACGLVGAIDKGRELHTKVIEEGFQKDSLVADALINMYVKCGLVAEAREVFDGLILHHVGQWNMLIALQVENGFNLEALESLRQMQSDGVVPDNVTYAHILKACCNLGGPDRGRLIHADILHRGLERNIFVGSNLVDICASNALIGTYAKYGLLGEARAVFESLPVRNSFVWTTMLTGYAENESGLETLNCFEEMKLSGISPDALTFACIIQACGNIVSITKGRKVHSEIIQKGFQEPILGINLIRMYANGGLLPDAQEVFDKLSIQDVTSCNVLLAGYAANGLGSEALKLFKQMELQGIFPNEETFVCILEICASLGALDKLREVHREIVRKGYEKDLDVASTLLAMYAKCGALTEAQEIFDQLPIRDVRSWTALILGYAENGVGEVALKRFEQMKMDGISPNSHTYVACLLACGNLKALDRGREMHNELREKGFETDISIGNTLVDMYCKCGSLSEAEATFDKLPMKGIVSWTAMIKAFSTSNEINKAIKCFEDMQKQGLKPDSVAFTSLLAACNQAGLVDKGQHYFNLMREYGVVITEDHYICMVDMLARSGKLHEAERLLKTAACPPSKEAWSSLLSASKKYGNTDLGLRCFQQLVKMNPGNASSYGLMGNIFANAGGWDNALKIEQMRKFAGAKKKPAKAIIEVNKQIHQFTVGEKRSEEIAAKIEELTVRLKEEGYVPNIDLVLKNISNKEKELALCGHAEKAAIAFGLLHTPQGHTLRMSKNLRMCNDCHNATKIISRIEKREIILRENNFIHRFKDGLCACGDMW